MKTASELSRDWSWIKSLRIPKADKVPKVLIVRGGVTEIEMAAVHDMGFPFSEVQDARDLLEDLDAWLRNAGYPQDTAV